MNLFINTLSTDSTIILFDSNRQIIDSFIWLAKGNESSTLIPNIDNLLEKNNIKYGDLEHIAVVNWPGSFTGVRTTVLVVNSINYIIHKKITALNFFDLYNKYPIIKASSKRDCFVKMKENSEIEIINNQDLEESLKNNEINTVYGDYHGAFFEGLEILDKIDYQAIIRDIKFDNPDKVEPLYIKKPNIS